MFRTFQVLSSFRIHSILAATHFSQPLGENYSESMIVHYSRPEALLSDVPNESFKIILSFSKHTLDSTADMADIPVSDRLT